MNCCASVAVQSGIKVKYKILVGEKPKYSLQVANNLCPSVMSYLEAYLVGQKSEEHLNASQRLVLSDDRS